VNDAGAGRTVRWPEAVSARVAAYYTRYYRDALGIPRWGDLVAARLDEEAGESSHLSRVEAALGRSVAGLRVLNVGCGTGGFSVLAQRAGASICGIDADLDAAGISASKAKDAGGLVVAAAAERLPFRDGMFDLVHCFSTLEHVDSAEATVAEMLRVARRGGAVYVHTPNALACYETHYKVFWLPLMPRPLARVYLRLRGRPTAFLDSLRLLTPRRLESLFARAGARASRLAPPAGLLRESGSPFWPLVRMYYRVFRVAPSIEVLARR
jgi:2-polyprenyl-3-methyl-5-hydroxy-6-metoxy-1,4-benzoquinol methylase